MGPRLLPALRTAYLRDDDPPRALRLRFLAWAVTTAVVAAALLMVGGGLTLMSLGAPLDVRTALLYVAGVVAVAKLLLLGLLVPLDRLYARALRGDPEDHGARRGQVVVGVLALAAAGLCLYVLFPLVRSGAVLDFGWFTLAGAGLGVSALLFLSNGLRLLK